MQKKIPRDQFNREIKIGDVITYPIRSGSSIRMSTSKVYSIEYDKKSRRVDEHDRNNRDREDYLEPKLKVKGVSKNWKGEVLGSYKSIVLAYERATILSDYTLEFPDDKK